MSKKSFILILVLSVIFWITSGAIQFIISFSPYSSCELTGYPIALCINPQSIFTIISIYVVNIALWFLAIWIIWQLILISIRRWFSKGKYYFPMREFL